MEYKVVVTADVEEDLNQYIRYFLIVKKVIRRQKLFWMILRLLFGALKVLQEVLAEVLGNPELTALLTSLARMLGGN